MNSRDKVLKAIKEAGPGGIINHELARVAGTKRYSARIQELRDSGWKIKTIRLNTTDHKFVLADREQFYYERPKKEAPKKIPIFNDKDNTVRFAYF